MDLDLLENNIKISTREKIYRNILYLQQLKISDIFIKPFMLCFTNHYLVFLLTSFCLQFAVPSIYLNCIWHITRITWLCLTLAQVIIKLFKFVTQHLQDTRQKLDILLEIFKNDVLTPPLEDFISLFLSSFFFFLYLSSLEIN